MSLVSLLFSLLFSTSKAKELTNFSKSHKNEAFVRLRNSTLCLMTLILLTYLLPVPSLCPALNVVRGAGPLKILAPVYPMPSFPYAIVNAFTRTSLGGNPAAIVLLPPSALSPPPIIDPRTLGAVSQSFAQPIAVFLARSPASGRGDDAEAEAAFDVRFFVNQHEVPQCGHGTLASAKALYGGMLHGLAPLRRDTVLRFTTPAGLTIRARAVPASPLADDADSDGERYEIVLPALPVEPVLGQERDRIVHAVARALRQDVAQLVVRHVARGTGRLDFYVLVELGPDQALDGVDVDTQALLDVGPSAVALTQLTPGKAHMFASRVFAPCLGLPEDHTCGSAHTLMVPYYASMPESTIRPGQEAYVRQVSPRGGDLWITLEEEKGIVVFRGNAKLFAKGELMI